jgi:hypothetical protein
MTRKEAFEIVKELDSKKPEALEHYLKITGFTEEEFYTIMEDHRMNVTDKLPAYKDDPYIRPQIKKKKEKVSK